MDQSAIYDTQMESCWSDMSVDTMELIFSKLPDSSVRTAGGACKRWHAMAKNFLQWALAREKSPKFAVFRVFGVKYSFTYRNGRYVVESVEDCANVPRLSCPEDGNSRTHCIEAAGELQYAFTEEKQTKVCYKLPRLDDACRVTPPLPRPTQDPVVGAVVKSGGCDSATHSLIFAGGDHEADLMEDGDDLAVSIYDTQSNSWEACSPLPSEFAGNTSSLCMGSVVHQGAFYAYDKISGDVSRLDIESKQWSAVQSIRPPAHVSELILVSQSRTLCLVGVETVNARDLRLKVWNVDADTMHVGELLCSKHLQEARAAPPSAVERRTARFLEPLARCVGVLLVLVLYLMRLCTSVSVRIASLLSVRRVGVQHGHGDSELQEDRPRSVTSERLD